MRIIKLSNSDPDMKTRDACINYFTRTIHSGYNRGRFGLTEDKSRMHGIGGGVLLLFCYKTELMFIARAAGEIRSTSDWAYIPLKMSTLHQVSGSLHDLEKDLLDRKLIDINLVNAQQWPILSEECEPIVLAFVSSPAHRDQALKLHEAMVELYQTAGHEIGYWGKRYLQSLKRNGGLATAKRMLRPKTDTKVDAGLQILKEFGRAHELSVEAIALRQQFRPLFTEQELAEAKRRLDLPVSPTKQSEDAPDSSFSGSVIDAAVNPGRGRKGQRYLQKPEERKAIEDRGMVVAERHLWDNNFKTKNVCKKESCDFRAYRGGKEYIVEVKATTGGGDEILLTRSELNLHRKRHPDNILIVVHGIKLERKGGNPRATGGEAKPYHKWSPSDAGLTPLAYRCQLRGVR